MPCQHLTLSSRQKPSYKLQVTKRYNYKRKKKEKKKKESTFKVIQGVLHLHMIKSP